MNSVFTRSQRIILKWTIGLLTLTGFAQMPIMKRYYIADLPGLSWLDQFFVTSLLHYLLAMIFLGLVFYGLTRYLLQLRPGLRPTGSGIFKGALFAVITVSGLLHVLGNTSFFTFSPPAAMAIDFAHLGAVMLLGLAALILALAGRKAYLRATS